MSIEIMIGDCRERLAATDLAYAAGVIDSDGTIGVRRSTYSMRIVGDAKVPIFAARVCVKQCQPEAVQLLKAMFGGSLRMNAPSATNGRPLHGWEVTHRRAINMLLAIRPYLRIKAAQADNCFALADQIAQSKVQRNATLIELNPHYAALARYRIDHARGPLLDRMEAAE